MAAYDLVVVGGGIVGTSIAYFAGKLGLRTCVVDRRDTGRATDAGAGILSPETEIRGLSELAAFAMTARETYDELVGELESETAFDACGLLVVALDAVEAGTLDRMLRTDGLTSVDPAEARTRFPPLGPVHAALYNPRAARVDGRLMTAALEAGARRSGVDFVGAAARELIVEGESVTAVVTADDRLSCRHLAIAGGAWSPALVDALGCTLPVQPQRGQIVHLRWHDSSPGGWPMVAGLRDHYLVPWPDGRIVVGATRETGSGFDPTATAAGLREVLDQALTTAPGLARAAIWDIRVGLRPLSGDGLPILGRIPETRNAWAATGHGAAGLMLGPHSGKVLAAAIASDDDGPLPQASSPARFGQR